MKEKCYILLSPRSVKVSVFKSSITFKFNIKFKMKTLRYLQKSSTVVWYFGIN